MTPTVYMRPRPQFSVSAGFIAIVSHVYHLETICHAIPLITFNNFTFTLLIGKKFTRNNLSRDQHTRAAW